MSEQQLRENKKTGFKCPGSMSIKQPIPEMFVCPNCGSEVEIWTNERMRKCGSCGQRVLREIDSASCVQWCQSARECIGAERYDELLRTGVISEDANKEICIPEKLREFMRECGVPIPGEGNAGIDVKANKIG